MTLLRKHRADLAACVLLALLPMLWLLPTLLSPWTGLSILPFDTLYLSEPWSRISPDLAPYNASLGDVILQNNAWRHLLRSYLSEGQIPFWNPHLLTGTPFLAGGQAGLLYPPAFLLLWGDTDFMATLYVTLHLALAGVTMFGFGRALRLTTWPACLAGLVYALGGFNYTHALFPTIVATSAWLPLWLAMIEIILRKQQAKGSVSFRPIPYLLLGALAIAMSALAGNPEFLAYGFLFVTAFTGVRLVILYLGLRRDSLPTGASTENPAPRAMASMALQRTAKQAVWLALMTLLGVSLAAVQIVPFAENYLQSHQEAHLSFQEVSDLAWPKRQILTFWVPNAFGNPSHHRWFDIWNGQWEGAPHNVFGLNNQAIDWGIRSYHVGASYVGIASWGLLLISVWTSLASGRLPPRQRQMVWIMLTLGFVALLFALGLPLYRLLSAIPGWSVIQTAYNWNYIFSFCMAVLAGLGLQALGAHDKNAPRFLSRSIWQRGVRVLGWSACIGGMGAFLTALAIWLGADWLDAPVHQLLQLSPYASSMFRTSRMFLGYGMGPVLHLGGAALGTGLLLLGFTSLPQGVGAVHSLLKWHGPLLLMVTLDLFVSHGRYLPVTDSSLASQRNAPPAIQFLQSVTDPPHAWRITTLTRQGQRFLDANLGFYYNWHDLRGKTFLIPASFQKSFQALGQTFYRGRDSDPYFNRSGHLYALYDSPRYLQSALLDMWNVKYLVTHYTVRATGWVEVYRDESLRIYENLEALPRAFVVPHAVMGPATEVDPTALDFATSVWLESAQRQEKGAAHRTVNRADTLISHYAANEVRVQTRTSDPTWLVLTDAHFPGWQATLHGPDHPDKGVEVPILKANGAFRAVELPAGFAGEVHFAYRPLSFRVGLFFSFLSAICGLMLLLWWGWGKYRRTDRTLADSMVVAKNFVVPLNLTLITRFIDFAFAMFYVRLLGPVGTGQFAFVVALYGIFELIARFGLDTLLTREVARDRTLVHRYLTNVCVLRTAIWGITTLLMFGVTLTFWWSDRITLLEVQAIAIFAIAMLFAGYSDAFSAVFHAHEKMEHPAILTTLSALLRAGIGALVLLLGWGLPALAWVAVITVIVQVVWFYLTLRKVLFRWQWTWDAPLQRWMLANSFPFMVNSLLSSILLNIDIWLLRLLSGEVASGLYSVALKYRFGITIIPSVFNFALFPLFSRYARQTGDGLMGAYRLSIRLLTLVSIPIAFATTLWAKPLVLLVGGTEFLDIQEQVTLFGWTWRYTGGSDLALQVVIWTIVLNFVNAVTQYVLIALDQQRYLTRAFIAVVGFNAVGNALLIPIAGYVGAALVTIGSELFLFVPFHLGIRRHLGHVGWLPLVWKPMAGLAVMSLLSLTLLSLDVNIWLTGIAAALGYLGTLYVTGEFSRLMAQLPWSDLQSFIQTRGPAAPAPSNGTSD